jgi:hypothetical protein
MNSLFTPSLYNLFCIRSILNFLMHEENFISVGILFNVCRIDKEDTIVSLVQGGMGGTHQPLLPYTSGLPVTSSLSVTRPIPMGEEWF